MFQRVKGTEDFYPEDKLVQQNIFSVLRDTAKKFGFFEVEAPVIESLNLLTAKSGEEIEKQIFVMEKKGSESREDIGLRFDLTVPMARMFAAKQKELQKPVKWFSIDKAWRYEAPQKGRQREFYQLSVELFGAKNNDADADLLNLLIACLENLGMKKKDFVIRINHRKLFEGMLAKIVPEKKIPDVARIIDKMGKISRGEFHKELSKQGLDAVKIEQIEHLFAFKGPPKDVLKKLEDHTELNELARQGVEELKKILAFVPEDYLIFDLSIMRGFDYYSGFVFECKDRQDKFRAIAGGGRYDHLIEILGGEPSPATGFGIGFSTLLLVLEESGVLKKISRQVDFFVAPVDETVRQQAFEIANALRKNYTVDIDLAGRKLSKQLEFANYVGAKNVVIVGSKDLKNNEVTIKNLETGKEAKKKIRDLEKL